MATTTMSDQTCAKEIRCGWVRKMYDVFITVCVTQLFQLNMLVHVNSGPQYIKSHVNSWHEKNEKIYARNHSWCCCDHVTMPCLHLAVSTTVPTYIYSITKLPN